jgi:epoxyqueuosine reductase QueG
MSDLTNDIRDKLLFHGADLVGIGNLSELPPEIRENLPIGISVAVKFPKEVIRGIDKLPTQEYCDWYNRLNERLDMLVTLGAKALQAQGYHAVAQTREHVGVGHEDARLLPHKTVATRAGLGWIGKCALLITKEYGSMIRLSSILTDAPLKTAEPINKSNCGGCMNCTVSCPGGAVFGKLWEVGMKREELFNAAVCGKTARERAIRGFGGDMTICGKCIEVCPFTKKYLKTD